MMVTSPGLNSIVCKQLQPSHGITSLLDIIVADVAVLDAIIVADVANLDAIIVADVANLDAVAWKFVKAEEDERLLQMLTTLQTSCWLHKTPVVVESESVVV